MEIIKKEKACYRIRDQMIHRTNIEVNCRADRKITDKMLQQSHLVDVVIWFELWIPLKDEVTETTQGTKK